MPKRMCAVFLCLLLTVLLPGCAKTKGGLADMATSSLLGLATQNSNLSTFMTLINGAGLGNMLGGSDPLTIFAPSNSAFDALPTGALDNLLKPENKSMLTDVLKNHVVSGALSADGLSSMTEAPKNLLGNPLDLVKSEGGGLSVNGANVTEANTEGSNGFIHVVDKVMLPGM